MTFDKNDREAIEAALADPDNPIAIAVSERIAHFTANLEKIATEKGRFPTELLLTKPKTEFDDIVIRLTLQTISDQLDREITIVWC